MNNAEANRKSLKLSERRESQPRLISNEELKFITLDLGEPEKVNLKDERAPHGQFGGTSDIGPCSSSNVNFENNNLASGSGNSGNRTTNRNGLPYFSGVKPKKIKKIFDKEERKKVVKTSSVMRGTIRYFCRKGGHGFIANDLNENGDYFVHISDVEGDYIPKAGDQVTYRLIPIPPKNIKFQAVHVKIFHFTSDVHHKWNTPLIEEEKNLKCPNNLVT